MATVAVVAVAAVLLVQPRWLFDVAEWAAPQIVWRVETSEPLVALTFDDGPAPGHTAVVLDLLARHGAHATFFMIGERAEAHPDLVEAVRKRGHEVGNHAYADRRTIGLSEEEFLADLRRTEEALDIAGPTKLYRPPSGLITPSQLALVREQGYRCVLGSAYPYDPAHPPTAYIEWLVTRKLAPGVIAILHDGIPDPSKTLEALDAILTAGQEKGLRFVTVSELLAAGSPARGSRVGPAGSARASAAVTRPATLLPSQAPGWAPEPGSASRSVRVWALRSPRGPARVLAPS